MRQAKALIRIDLCAVCFIYLFFFFFVLLLFSLFYVDGKHLRSYRDGHHTFPRQA